MLLFKSKTAKYIIIGLGGGLVNGFLGAGGGMVVLPLLIRWTGMEEKKAMATTVMIIAPLCALSAVIYWSSGGLDLQKAWPYLAGGFVGGLLAGVLFKKAPPGLLRRAFGALLAFGGLRMLLG